MKPADTDKVNDIYEKKAVPAFQTVKKLAPAAGPSVHRGGVWPTAPQELLLRAALLDASAALDAWTKWQTMVQTDALEAASWMLIPLVYINLKRLGVDDPLLPQAKACHLHYWCSNQKLFHLAAGFLEELRRMDIPVLVLKGAALANLYYPDIGCRPMTDFDVLVPVEKFLPLGRYLIAQGWQETDGHSLASFQTDRMPSFGFMRPDGFQVDVHCHVLHENCSTGADDAFWAHAKPWALNGSDTLTLAAEDQLLHVISHGVRWCDSAPFRWIADAWWILAGSRDRFDWQRFLEQARFHETNPQILRGLERMRRITPVDIPADFLPRLEGLPVSARARVRFAIATHPLPRSFFPRALGIWKALGGEEPVRSATGKARRTLSLLLFACEIAIRDRKKILAESFAWMRRLFK